MTRGGRRVYGLVVRSWCVPLALCAVLLGRPAFAEPNVALVLPKPLSDTSVAYPNDARGSAAVVLEVAVSPTGVVEDVIVITGEEPFATATVAAARHWVFTPAQQDGRAISVRIRFEVRFTEPVRAVRGAPADAPGEDPVVEIVVEGERPFGGDRITRAEARQLPGAFGNPLRAIETLPGVTPTVSGMPYFYVRGAPPGNVGYFLDGHRLPALFHVLAGPSVVHPALLDEVEFHAGPYPARYGRFAGAIAAASLRPFEYELHGEANVRAFDSSALVEVPLAERTSASVSGRYSYANPIARLFAPDISVRYWDYQVRLGSEVTPRDQLELFVFGSLDDLTNEEDGETQQIFGSEFHRFAFSHRHDLDDGWVKTSVLVGADRSAQQMGDVTLTDTLTQLRSELGHQIGESATLLTGFDVGHDRYSLTLGNVDDETARADFVRRFPSRVESVAGAHGAVMFDPVPYVHLALGVRTDVYAAEHESAVGVSPRVAAEFDLAPGIVATHAFGIADQPPSNPFPQPGATPALQGGLQRALQSSAGVRVSTWEALSIEATLFQSVAFDLSDGPGISRIDNDDESIEEDSRATGTSRGLELSLRRSPERRTSGYVSYTLARADRSVGRAEGPALFDRRHVLSGAVSHRFGSGFHAGLRGMLYSGIPADVAYLEAAKDPPRTPPFYRIDFRAEKRFSFGSEREYWAIVAEVLNTTLSEEILGMSCNAYTCRSDAIGPVTVPSLGLEAFF